VAINPSITRSRDVFKGGASAGPSLQHLSVRTGGDATLCCRTPPLESCNAAAHHTRLLTNQNLDSIFSFVTVPHPKQARSEATLQRIVNATEKLLTRYRLDEITIAEIVRNADSSVGAFYGRFPDKEALLEYIDEVYARKALAAWADFLDPHRWAGKPLRSMVSAIISRMMRSHREKSGVARALYLYVRTGAPPALVARAQAINHKVEGLIVKLLMHRRRELRPRNAPAAIRTATMFTVSAIREAVLFGDLNLHTHCANDEQLIRELTQAFCTYVQTALPRRTHVT
jgi:AcrR family transcriptional regulator